ncbi:MAG: hypothetical protein ACREBC_27390 [Pyrinomonadaceae bacterium]
MLFDTTIKEILGEHLSALEKHFDADVIFFYRSDRRWHHETLP